MRAADYDPNYDARWMSDDDSGDVIPDDISMGAIAREGEDAYWAWLDTQELTAPMRPRQYAATRAEVRNNGQRNGGVK